jgi:hypothetical protein
MNLKVEEGVKMNEQEIFEIIKKYKSLESIKQELKQLLFNINLAFENKCFD